MMRAGEMLPCVVGPTPIVLSLRRAARETRVQSGRVSTGVVTAAS